MNNNSAVNLPHDEYTPCIFEQTFSYPVSACATAITSVAVFGNLLVCLAILANRHLRNNPKNLFILSLALSDFLAAIIVMPFDIELLFRIDFEWYHGEAFCILCTLIPYPFRFSASWPSAWIDTRPSEILWLGLRLHNS